MLSVLVQHQPVELSPHVNTTYTIFITKLLYITSPRCVWMGHFHVLISWMLSWGALPPDGIRSIPGMAVWERLTWVSNRRLLYGELIQYLGDWQTRSERRVDRRWCWHGRVPLTTSRTDSTRLYMVTNMFVCWNLWQDQVTGRLVVGQPEPASAAPIMFAHRGLPSPSSLGNSHQTLASSTLAQQRR